MKKLFGLFCLLYLLFALPVFAGVLETVKAAASTGNIVFGLILVVLLWVMKAIPNDKIYNTVYVVCEKGGIIVTLGLTKWKWSAPFWNAHVEPWFINLIDNTVGAAVNGFIYGLRSDAPTPDAPVEPPPYEG
jgi:hypothetical protein